MNCDIFKDVLIDDSESCLMDSFDKENKCQIPEKYLKIYDQMKKCEIMYDSDNDCYFTYKNIDAFLSERRKSRISRFNALKWKLKLNIPYKAEEMFIEFLDLVYYKKSINYLYFIKKILDYYNIDNNLKVKFNKKNEDIWNSILKIVS